MTKNPPLTKSKKNWIRNRDVYLRGTPLHYNASIQAEFQKELRTLVAQMAKDTEKQVITLFKPVFATMDASITSEAKELLGKLTKEFQDKFNKKSIILAQSMVDKPANTSARMLKSSLKKLTGQSELKTNFIPADLRPKINSLVEENVKLIKSLPEEYFNDVNSGVMRSITTGQGLKSLTTKLEKYYGTADNRAKNIAADQTRYAYNVINQQRMISSGFKDFEWLHSGGGMHPRPDHVAMSGKVYSLTKLPIIDKKTGERGLPGQLYNCGCTMIPVYRFPKGY